MGRNAALGLDIDFAHSTFQWSNDAPGIAAVHCVIVGFGAQSARSKQLWSYADMKAHSVGAKVVQINPYLVEAPIVLIQKRRGPICVVPEIIFGSKATDGGNLLLSDQEKTELLASEPRAAPWIRPFLGADEFINGVTLWCLWLEKCPPTELAKLKLVKTRIEAVRTMSLASTKEPTQELALTPALFGENRQIAVDYLLIPRVSSERRQYVPIGCLSANTVCADANFMLPNAQLFHFAILCTHMHMAWMRYVCGRLKSDFRYSNTIVYNNFPWPNIVNHIVTSLLQLVSNVPLAQSIRAYAAPETIAFNETDATTAKLIAKIEAAAHAVLDARALHQTGLPPGAAPSTLAQLYDPTTMPANLAKAHAALDKAIDTAYTEDGGAASYAKDGKRVAFLFKRYAALTSLV